MSEQYCRVCGKLLTNDEIAMHKKAVNRGDTSFYCLDCLSEHFRVDKKVFEEKIEYLKKMGCTLFNNKKV